LPAATAILEQNKECVMSTELVRYHPPASDHLHPFVYAAAAAFALWLVASAWALFSGSDTELVFMAVSALIAMVFAIPFALWLAWRKQQGAGAGERDSFRHWAGGEFETWQCRVSGTEAAVEILLPIAALAFGLTAIGIVLQLTAHGIL
jgi:hypothetical protein